MADDASRWLVAFAGRRLAVVPDLSALDGGACPEEALPPARLVWRRRVVNEALSVDLARRLRELSASLGGLGGEVDGALARLEEDEASHVDLAAEVLRRIGGEAAPAPARLKERDEPAEAALARCVITGLSVCETVSAARFAAVRDHTDLPVFRACIELFHRDELAHAELGFKLLPRIIERLSAALGPARAAALAEAELRETLGILDRTIGLDFERKGGPPPARPQPTGNPGVVEPAIDAIAFYRAIHGEVLPRLEALGLPAQRAWEARHTTPL